MAADQIFSMKRQMENYAVETLVSEIGLVYPLSVRLTLWTI